MMPIVAQVQQLLEGKAQVVQLDIDKYQQEAQDSGVESVPTFIVLKDGQEQWLHSGEIEAETLLAEVMKYC